jgi:3-oxoacyl-[acyl-carrier protein] reductase
VLEDVAGVAAFVASDKARTMTAATANVSGGALID